MGGGRKDNLYIWPGDLIRPVLDEAPPTTA